MTILSLPSGPSMEGNATFAELRDEIRRLRDRVLELEKQLVNAGKVYGELRMAAELQERSLRKFRDQVEPLYMALRGIFGELDAFAPFAADAASGASAPKSPVWESWKQRLGGLPAKAIDALLMHGELSRAQLRIHCQCATRSVTDIVYKLNQAGLINKNGGKISLKEMR